MNGTDNHFIRPVKFPPTSTCRFHIKAEETPYRLLPPLLCGNRRWNIFWLRFYCRCIDIQRSREEVHPSPALSDIETATEGL
jgi:hypothetical protein